MCARLLLMFNRVRSRRGIACHSVLLNYGSFGYTALDLFAFLTGSEWAYLCFQQFLVFKIVQAACVSLLNFSFPAYSNRADQSLNV